MTDSLGMLRPFLDRISTLPPLPWFSQETFHEACAIVTEADAAAGQNSGLEVTMACEILDRTVNGMAWGRDHQPNWAESQQGIGFLGPLLKFWELDDCTAQSVLLHVPGIRVHLGSEELCWWLRYEAAVIAAFAKRGATIDGATDDDIAFLVDNSDFDYLVGMVQLGFRRQRMQRLLSRHSPVLGARVFAAASSGWRDADWK